MVDRKNESVRSRFRNLLGYLAWFMVLILLISTVKNVNRVFTIRREVLEERQKVEKMQNDNAKLQSQVAEAQGTEFIEKQIRDKLGLTKAGEAIVVLPEEPIVRSLAPPLTVSEDILPDPNWVKWKKMFF